MRLTSERSRVKMAAGSDLLDDVFFNTEVDEKVVSDLVGSLESELTGSGRGNSAVRIQAAANHIGNSNVQDSKMGLSQELAKPGTSVQGGVINSTRSTMDTAAGTTAAGSSMTAGHSQSKTGTAGGVLTVVPDHREGIGKTGAAGVVQTLNGSNVVINSHNLVSSASSTVPAVTVVNNGPGSVVKGNVILPSTSSTVIQTSLMHNAVTSTVISSQPSVLNSVPTVTLVRPPMQNPGTVTSQSGRNTFLTSTVNVAHPACSGAQVNKSETPKTIIQTTAQVTGTTTAALGKSPVLQNVRTSIPSTIATSPGGIRAIAPQVLAPILPQPQQNAPNIQNIQLPPGMVLVRSESGQLLMIHQQTLAQMQAQSQSQSAMTPRPATPTSTPPVQITSVQAPGMPLMARQVTPTTVTKQGSPAQSTVQATTTLQRPPVLQQNTIMLGGAAATPSQAPVQPGSAAAAVTQRAGTPGTTGAPGTPTTITETLENVKKCKNFLSTLIKLASSGKQSSETTASVKDLVKSLLEGKIEAEEFTSRLYRELNSSPQPYLVPFLKRSLPALRQMTPDSTAFIQQSQLPQASAQPASSSTALTSVVLGGTAAAQRPPLNSTTSPGAKGTLHQSPVISLAQTPHSKPGLMVPQQQGAMASPQVTLAQAPMVTLRGQPHSRIMGQPQVVKQLQTVPVVKQALASGAKGTLGLQSMLSVAQKNKLKEASGGTFKDDDDINDVASMAGVNLSEESARILATNSELVGAVTRSCKDEAFLYTSSLTRRVQEIGRRFGVTDLGPEVINYVSHATQQRLQNLLEKVTEVAQQKNITFKEDDKYEQVSDVRAQLKFFEQLDQMEKQRKEEQEREILMKAAKSRSRQEDPEQLRLKQKAKEMQQQELNQIRQKEANMTALAAIGPRKKRKMDSPVSGAGAEGSGSGPSLSGGSSSGGSRPQRQRITRVNLRDLLFCLENERETSSSHLLYKGFLK
ncbi:transcription initiation factor TFIID subunit 4 [Coregonus clupeaformis]|uniref:transcription initiation factor TFIID subunit 4 n=1 Tax=Coregonus clupeaformis TaxID=59861 RepID=UPI001BE120DC|nr:transcription initiation factor TFIID subunit 4 [Coregonus clupeaformis]